MNNYFEYSINYNQISFCYTDKAKIDEREIHSYNEILFFMGKEATFLTESFKKQIGKHSLIVIPKEKYHYFDVKKECTFERLKIRFPDSFETEENLLSSDGIRIIDKINDDMLFLLKKICSSAKNCNSKAEKLEAYGAFLMLMAQISKLSSEPAEEKNVSPLVSGCIELINNSLKTPMNIRCIAKKLNVSESAITHSFKKEMGISVHKYIQQKRLILANSLIESGYRPSKIYLDCGYSDYSAFYKAYFKMFGCSPSEKTTQ